MMGKRSLVQSLSGGLRNLFSGAEERRHWLLSLLAGRAQAGRPKVNYGAPPPSRKERFTGGMVKFQRLAHTFPHEPHDYNLLYLGSSSLPWDWSQQIRIAKLKAAPFVWNQNGVGYPGCYPDRWEQINEPLREGITRADHVFYQSKFCRRSAQKFLGDPQGTWEILYNAVDTRRFEPSKGSVDPEGPHLLLGGTQDDWYKLDVALETLGHLHARGIRAHLTVTGKPAWGYDPDTARRKAEERCKDLGIEQSVTFLGPYTQEEAPDIFRSVDLLLHTKVNDPCPNVVLEAMASGLPVAYSATGGTPELVGDEAGIGVPGEERWDELIPPRPEELADAAEGILDDHGRYARASRSRAEDCFDLESWIKRHRQTFETLLGNEEIHS